jgi:hypothetical protein
LLTWVAWAQEHPQEHPTTPSEHPQERPTRKALTKETLAKAIEDYVKKDTKLKGGYFLVYDKAAKRPLVLTLVRVHKERLAAVGKGVYFACADFKTPDGVLYDLDFFMKETPQGLQTTEIHIHKERGQPRYTWHFDEKAGLWKRRPVQTPLKR